MKLTTVSGFKFHLRAGLWVIASLALAACGGSSNNGGSSRYAPVNNQGTLNPPPSASSSNSMPIVLDAGPQSSGRVINIPYVSVTVCTPGTTAPTAACQTIDHVVLDTGSSGLRLLNSALYTNLNLPAAINGNGRALGECAPFAIGTTWGSVRLADVYLAGEVARSVPFQAIGDKPGGAAGVPTDCFNTGTITDDQASLGANGILGIGLFKNDCDACLTQAITAAYYACTAQGCTKSTVAQSQVVKNPVSLFAVNNNGTLINLPSVADAGATGSVTGTLIFGIGTQANNMMNGAIVYPTDARGNFKTTYNNAPVTYSFIDSGSNGLFFSDAGIVTCSLNTWAYCPAMSPANLSATTAGAGGSPSSVVNFKVINLDNLANNVIAAHVGAIAPSSQFDWGLPFFFGRPVFTAISGAGTIYGTGPYWAY